MAMSMEALRSVVKSQYHAALAMLRNAIEQCPEDLWASSDHSNPFWRIAYHTLYFTHLYLQPRPEAFRAWAHHQTGIQYMDDIPGPPEIDDLIEPPHRPPQTGEPYTKTQILEYQTWCERMIDDAVDALELVAEDSGFSWYPIPKLEHQIASIRHIQHHTAQLAQRLWQAEGIETEWIGARRSG